MKKKKRKVKYGNIIAIIVIIVSLILMIYSSYNIITWYIANKENSKIKDDLQNSIVIEEVEKEEEIVSLEYKIDFDSLKEKNNETIGYIKVNGTNIDYVVVKHSDNSYYLNHNFEKKSNKAGWIFADYHNKFDETDRNIVIFGHNTKDGSMFGTLRNVIKENWYNNKDNYEVMLVTENGTYYYQVFSTYSIKAEDYYINTIFNSDNEFYDFIKKIKARSVHDYGIELSKSDKILTLSSCIGDGSKRVVLHAKLVDK